MLSYLMENGQKKWALKCICLLSSVVKNILLFFFHGLCAVYVHAFRVYLLKVQFFCMCDTSLNIVAAMAVNISALCHVSQFQCVR